MNMESQESFSVMTDIWQLEQGGFRAMRLLASSESKRSISEESMTRPIPSRIDWRLSAGFTCRVAWKANQAASCSNRGCVTIYPYMALRKTSREFFQPPEDL